MAHDWRKTDDGALDWIGEDIENPDVERALVEVIKRLPDDDFEKLDDVKPRIIYSPNSGVRVRHYTFPASEADRGYVTVRQWEVILKSSISEQAYELIVAEIAHELGHVILEHETPAPFDECLTREFEACAWAIRAGFAKETLAMLREPEMLGNLGSGTPWDHCMQRLHELEALASEE